MLLPDSINPRLTAKLQAIVELASSQFDGKSMSVPLQTMHINALATQAELAAKSKKPLYERHVPAAEPTQDDEAAVKPAATQEAIQTDSQVMDELIGLFDESSARIKREQQTDIIDTTIENTVEQND
jgi:hypothetical protein